MGKRDLTRFELVMSFGVVGVILYNVGTRASIYWCRRYLAGGMWRHNNVWLHGFSRRLFLAYLCNSRLRIKYMITCSMWYLVNRRQRCYFHQYVYIFQNQLWIKYRISLSLLNRLKIIENDWYDKLDVFIYFHLSHMVCLAWLLGLKKIWFHFHTCTIATV